MSSAARMNKRHRQQHVAVEEPVEDLLGGGAEVEPRNEQVEDRGADHRQPDRQAQDRQHDQDDDAQREVAGHGHAALSGIVAGFRRRAADGPPGEADVLHDDGQREDDVDGVEVVEAHVQVGGVLALHERHVVPGGRQRYEKEHDDREAGRRRKGPSGTPGDQPVDDVEPDLVLIRENESRAPQHQPIPSRGRSPRRSSPAAD